MALQQQPAIAPNELVAGVDTHTDTHTLAVLTAQGATVLTETFTADRHGYTGLINALCSAGEVAVVGVEGTNSYGAGLARALAVAGFPVKEVLRPTRRVRRMHGKSDPIDAVEAARTVLNGQTVSEAKDTDTPAESLRMLLTARSQLVTTATALGNTITSLLVTAPESVRAKYRSLTTKDLVERLSGSRPGTNLQDPRTAAVQSMRTIAQFHHDASARAA